MKIKFMNVGIVCMSIFIHLTAYSQTGMVFKQWGEETLTKIEQDYRISGSNLYYENTDHNAISLSGNIPCLNVNNIDNSISSLKVKAKSPENTNTRISNQFVRKVSEFENADEHAELLLFPNPAVDQLNLEGIGKVKCVKVYSLQGKEIFSVKNPGQSVNVQSISQGLYIVVVENEKNKLFRKKFLKK